MDYILNLLKKLDKNVKKEKRWGNFYFIKYKDTNLIIEFCSSLSLGELERWSYILASIITKGGDCPVQLKLSTRTKGEEVTESKLMELLDAVIVLGENNVHTSLHPIERLIQGKVIDKLIGLNQLPTRRSSEYLTSTIPVHTEDHVVSNLHWETRVGDSILSIQFYILLDDSLRGLFLYSEISVDDLSVSSPKDILISGKPNDVYGTVDNWISEEFSENILNFMSEIKDINIKELLTKVIQVLWGQEKNTQHR